MKQKLTFLLMAVLLTAGFSYSSAQLVHFKEGFGAIPEGWTDVNIYLSSSSLAHNEYEGAKSLKMKPESSIETSEYDGAAVLSYWIYAQKIDIFIKTEKSIDGGSSWVELETFTTTASDTAVALQRIITVDDESSAIKFKISATVEASGDLYIDDMMLTKPSAGSDDATLFGITVNGDAVEGFTSEVMHYSVNLPYTTSVEVEGISNDTNATAALTPASNIFGDSLARTAIIKVTSKDESNSLVYSVTLNVSNDLIKAGFPDEDELPGDGWTANRTIIQNKQNHGDYEGDGAFKFTGSDAESVGFLQSPIYNNMGTLSFWMKIEKRGEFTETGSMQIDVFVGASADSIFKINLEEPAIDTSWKEITLDLNIEDSAYIKFSPSMDADIRMWMDDLKITSMGITEVGVETINANNYNYLVYPNPVSNQLNVVLTDAQASQISLYTVSGTLVYSNVNPVGTVNVDLSNLSSGMYILKLEGDFGTSTQKIIKK